MKHWSTCETICILGAEREREKEQKQEQSKTKKKRWWQPWVDHASSRLTTLFFSSTLIGYCVLDQNSQRISMLHLGLQTPWKHSVVTSVLFWLYLRPLVWLIDRFVYWLIDWLVNWLMNPKTSEIYRRDSVLICWNEIRQYYNMPQLMAMGGHK